MSHNNAARRGLEWPMGLRRPWPSRQLLLNMHPPATVLASACCAAPRASAFSLINRWPAARLQPAAPNRGRELECHLRPRAAQAAIASELHESCLPKASAREARCGMWRRAPAINKLPRRHAAINLGRGRCWKGRAAAAVFCTAKSRSAPSQRNEARRRRCRCRHATHLLLQVVLALAARAAVR